MIPTGTEPETRGPVGRANIDVYFSADVETDGPIPGPFSMLSDAHSAISSILEHYEEFLASTDEQESVLVERFLDAGANRKAMQFASEFGELVFDLITKIGDHNRFHRLLVV